MNELAGSQEARTIPSTTPLPAKLAQKRTAWILWIATLVVAALAVVFAALSRAAPRPEWHPWALAMVEPVVLIAYAYPGLEVISFGESAVADEGAGDAGEGEEVLGFALVASVETSTPGEPGHGAFDGPAVAAQSLRGLDSLAGDAVHDAAPA